MRKSIFGGIIGAAFLGTALVLSMGQGTSPVGVASELAPWPQGVADAPFCVGQGKATDGGCLFIVGNDGGAAGAVTPYRRLPPRGDEFWGFTCGNGSVSAFGTHTASFSQTITGAEGVSYMPSLWQLGCYGGGNSSTAPDAGSLRNLWAGGSDAYPTSNSCFTFRLLAWVPDQLSTATSPSILDLYSSIQPTLGVYESTSVGQITLYFNNGTGTTVPIPTSVGFLNTTLSGPLMLTVMVDAVHLHAWLNGQRVVMISRPTILPVFSGSSQGWRLPGQSGAVVQQFQLWNSCTETTAQEEADWATLRGM